MAIQDSGMQPTIGRIVHYTGLDGIGPRAAIIIGLARWKDDDTIGLNVFYEDGHQAAVRATHSSVEDRGTWRWPPRA